MASALLRVGRAPIGSRRVLGVRDVHLDRIRLDGILETFRHYSDDRVGAPIEHENAADYFGRAIKMGLPESITQDDFEPARATARLLIRALESATHDRLYAQHVEEFAAHFDSTKTLRFLFIDQSEIEIAIRRHATEAATLVAEIEEIRIAHRTELWRRSCFGEINSANGNKLLRRGKRQRLEEDRIDHAEDGGVGADSERESQDGDESEARMLDQLAQAVANVGHHMLRISAGRFCETPVESGV